MNILVWSSRVASLRMGKLYRGAQREYALAAVAPPSAQP
jgi:hypothetical protein